MHRQRHYSTDEGGLTGSCLEVLEGCRKLLESIAEEENDPRLFAIAAALASVEPAIAEAWE